MKITYLDNAQIDRNKWQLCLIESGNALIYASVDFLDCMSPGWSALVMNDYEAIMPLVWNKKWGIRYLYQPPFTQQSGIFSPAPVTSEITKAFISKALKHFQFIEINLNFDNPYPDAEWKNNSILSLNAGFETLKKTFHKDVASVEKCVDLQYTSCDDIKQVVHLFHEYYGTRIYTPPKTYERLLLLFESLKKKEQLFIRQVHSAQNQLLSMALFLKDNKRIYYLLSVTLPEGRMQKSNYFLLYQVIKEFSGQPLILDFEGSAIESINFFFKKFGTMNEPYPSVYINRLPAWQQWIKQQSDRLRQ